MSTHANRVKMTVTSVDATPSTGLGAITLNAASTGFRSFATAYGANATVDILITEGTAWEIARNCTYTHSGTTVSRGTLENSSTGNAVVFTSAAVVSVIATAAFGNNAALNHVAGGDADTTMAVGNMYVTAMSAWATADRTYTLPADAAVGDRIGIMVTSGNASYELIIKPNTSDTINGGTAAAEWSRLFITGEVVILRCVTANSAWVVEYDGRIKPIVNVTGNGSTTQTPTRDTNTKLAAVYATVAEDAASNWSVANKRLEPRRPGVWSISVLVTLAVPGSGKAVLSFLQIAGGAYVGNAPISFGNAAANIASGLSTTIRMAAGESLEAYIFYNDATADKSTTAGANENYFRAVWLED